MKINNVGIVGMGALGILYGDILTRALGRDCVGFIADRARIERYRQAEITANGARCDFRLFSGDDPAAEPFDLVIFAVKATGLARAMADAKPYIGANTVLLSVLNGITSERELEAQFGDKNVVYCVVQGMDAVKTGGALTCMNIGHIFVGIPESAPQKQPALDAVCALLTRIQIPFTRESDILHRLWGKFMLNVGVNQAVMVYEGTYGTIQAPGEPRETMIAAMREVLALSKYEGVPLTEADLNAYVALMDTMYAPGMPSMRQDGLNKRKSEVELFSGTVCRLARKHGLPTPVNDRLYAIITRMESEY